MPDYLPEKLLTRMSEAAGKMECAMIRGNFQQVRALVDEAEKDFKDYQREDKAKLTDHVSALDLDVRTCNALEHLRIFTVYDLLTTSQAVIMNVPGISDRTWEMIETRLTSHGYFHGGHKSRIAELERTGFRALEPS
jgi:DNA-directed RNA polymerase alpha subunit